ncbi:Detected protein of confused Function [Hibiscus syriacus]|uniref:Detected protein of confused Function n=1 Tax=Hibiscus syriacus TaxID=106335 RepID=A0A6A3A099_HIBSY|nr:Detected protein of confused Function [Hibiscus syriacus]
MQTLSFSKSKNINIVGLTSLNGQMFHVVNNGCQNIKLIQTDDDCVSIGPGATNLLMEKITCSPGHGISVGSLGKDQNEAGVQNVTNFKNPIVVDQNYFPGNKNCPDQVPGVKVSDVTYQDIHGTLETEVAVNFNCSSKHPCSWIRMEGVTLTYKNAVAAASCKHAGGTSLGVVQPTSCL